MRNQGVNPKRVLSVVGVLLLSALVAFAWPLLSHAIQQRNELRAFQVADDALQAELVRTYLQHELAQPRRLPSGELENSSVIFDTRSAALCSVKNPVPCDEMEYLSIERGDALLDAGDHSKPLELQRLLDRVALKRSENQDPHLAGVTTISAEASQVFADACSGFPERGVQFIRISRAAVQHPQGPAIAMVLTRYCDQSGGVRVVTFL